MPIPSPKAYGIKFARRTNWDFNENNLARAGKELKAQGIPIADLTVSNPTKCGLDYSMLDVASAFSSPENLNYVPDAWGISCAREAIVRMYADKGLTVPVERVMLTSSTSEGYNYVFRLLCDYDDEVLAPVPSYPLFQFLADVNDVRIAPYPLVYDKGWRIDHDALRRSITKKTKAIIVVNPNNPTGSFLCEDDARFIFEIAAERGLAVICDEVFADYELSVLPDAQKSLVGKSGAVLTFVLSGLSKILAMPQMKLSWVIVQGAGAVVDTACQRLEMIADTFLSVNTPVQNACPALIAKRALVQTPIMERLKTNYRVLSEAVAATPGLSLMVCEGGWYAVVEMEGIADEDAFTVELLRQRHVQVHPGYYYDFDNGEHAVFSLLVEPTVWARGVAEFVSYYTEAAVI